MKDFLGNNLNIGDEVVYVNHYRTSSDLNRGVVVGFSPMKVRVDTYNEAGEQLWRELKCPHQVAKVKWSEVIND